MKLTNDKLSHGSKHDDVKEQLHPELQLLGYTIAVAERDEGFFGDETRLAVVDFQRDHGLPVTGVVNNKTAMAINEAVAARQANFVVRGHVQNLSGASTAGLIVRAFDVDLRQEQQLGEE